MKSQIVWREHIGSRTYWTKHAWDSPTGATGNCNPIETIYNPFWLIAALGCWVRFMMWERFGYPDEHK